MRDMACTAKTMGAAEKSAEPSMSGDSPNLDLLRSLAVLFVVTSHLPPVAALFSVGAYYHLQALGVLGVVIFFVHTCLVLMLSLERQTWKNGTYRRATQFFLRRAFRIYPLSVTTVVTVAIVSLHASGETPLSFPETVANLFLVQNLANMPSSPPALWSLPFEVQMYLALPALFGLVIWSKRWAVVAVGTIWLGGIAITLAAWKLGWNYHLVKYVPCFLPGVLAYAMASDEKRYASPTILFAYVAICAWVMPWAVAHGAQETIIAWPICLGLGLIIPFCRELSFAPLRRSAKIVARYSYGIYLVHGPCIDLAFDRGRSLPSVVQWGILSATLPTLSYAAYRLVEKPCIALGAKWASHWAYREAVAASDDSQAG